MRFPGLVIACCVFIVLCSYSTGRAQCEKVAPIKLPIIFEFKSGEFRLQEIYDSLDPRLQEPSGEMTRPHSERITDGKLELDFCVSNLLAISSFSVFIGPRKIAISKRQMKHANEMAIVWMLNQDDPDWLIVRNAKWVSNADGSPTFDIEVQNFANSGHSGAYLSLDFSGIMGRLQCAFPEPRVARIYVSLSFNKGKLIARSTDPQFDDLIKREADLFVDVCSGTGRFTMALGSTGQLAGKDHLRVRYVFKNMRIETKKGEALNVKNFSFFLNHKIRISGDRVFPAEIRIAR